MDHVRGACCAGPRDRSALRLAARERYGSHGDERSSGNVADCAGRAQFAERKYLRRRRDDEARCGARGEGDFAWTRRQRDERWRTRNGARVRVSISWDRRRTGASRRVGYPNGDCVQQCRWKLDRFKRSSSRSAHSGLSESDCGGGREESAAGAARGDAHVWTPKGWNARATGNSRERFREIGRYFHSLSRQ